VRHTIGGLEDQPPDRVLTCRSGEYGLPQYLRESMTAAACSWVKESSST